MPEEREWTKSQERAITSGGQAIVVSAAAGSGKTTVLIERIIQKILDKGSDCNVDELLIVTFTRAATAEIRSRLSSAITEKLKTEPNNDRLVTQQMLIPSANIFTIDAFCADIIRNNFEQLGIRPDFKTLDEGLRQVYMTEALSTVFDKYYDENSDGFNLLKDIIKDTYNYKLEKAITTIYDKAQAYKDPLKVLEDSISYYKFSGPAKDSPVVQEAINGFLDYADYIIAGLDRCIQAFKADEANFADKNGRKAHDILCDNKAAFEECCGYIRDADFDRAFDFAAEYKPGSWPGAAFPLKGSYEDTLAKYYRGIANSFTHETNSSKALRDYFVSNLEVFESDRKTLLPALETLVSIVKDFSEEYSRVKEENNVFDFSDIEHLAYRLLIENGEKTQLARDLSTNYKEILIDEYQDTNELQDALFTAISDDEKNLFMVGDIKQSIYGFRNAMPDLFRYKAENYPGKMPLGENFRCTYGIVEYVNFLFSQIMTKSCGDVDYRDNDHKLVYGRPEKKDRDRADVELHLLDGNKNANLPQEGKFIARYIEECMQENDKLRYSDFAILMRKVASDKGSKIAQELTKANIPVAFEGGDDFFDTADVKIVLSLLHVIDNPLQDVHMLATLMSPVFSLSADKVTEIRCHNKYTSLYANLLSLKDKDEQIKTIVDTIALYRRLSISMPVGELIRKIYSDTLLPDIVAAMPNGPSRQANLLLLQNYADNYEQNSELGISNFVRFIDTLIDNDLDLQTASLGSGTTNAVKLMTIHKSKGLQFTYCIVPNLGDGRAPQEKSIVISKDMKIGLKACNPITGDTFNSFIYNHIRKIDRVPNKSEELRILYVAMTRAKEKLVLIGSPGGGGISNGISKSELTENNTLYPYAVIDSSNPLELIISATAHHNKATALRDTDMPSLSCDVPVKVECHPEETEEEKAQNEPEPLPTEIDEKMLTELTERMNYEYPYLALATVPTKRSASATEAAGFDDTFFASARPEFMMDGKLTAAQKGTCLHLFMQFADFNEAKNDPKAEVERLYNMGFFTRTEANSIDTDKVRAFFDSDVAKRMYRDPDFMREKKFAVLVPAVRFNPELKGELAEEKVMIQGIADCVFVEDNQLVIVDYKTDRTRSEDELKRRHKAQLQTYAEALKESIGLPVKEAYIYAFSLDKEIKVF